MSYEVLGTIVGSDWIATTPAGEDIRVSLGVVLVEAWCAAVLCLGCLLRPLAAGFEERDSSDQFPVTLFNTTVLL